MSIIPGNALASLTLAKDFLPARISSFDVSGGNADAWNIQPGEAKTLADIKGPGVISHIWFTISSPIPSIFANFF